jgi:hypothetical protein
MKKAMARKRAKAMIKVIRVAGKQWCNMGNGDGNEVVGSKEGNCKGGKGGKGNSNGNDNGRQHRGRWQWGYG